jgi:hypothetical protein
VLTAAMLSAQLELPSAQPCAAGHRWHLAIGTIWLRHRPICRRHRLAVGIELTAVWQFWLDFIQKKNLKIQIF